ncbi:MAG: IS5/IS1182 family transposase, partial [Bacteroidales bacterium]|nr:IS5/IS1182 family transposase [Bacteroidales bacterium]
QKMMDRQHGAQQKMLCVTMETLMPEKHFLRDLDRLVDFNFVYDKVEGLYSHTGRRSVDPVVIVKMMLLGYLYGIR